MLFCSVSSPFHHDQSDRISVSDNSQEERTIQGWKLWMVSRELNTSTSTQWKVSWIVLIIDIKDYPKTNIQSFVSYAIFLRWEISEIFGCGNIFGLCNMYLLFTLRHWWQAISNTIPKTFNQKCHELIVDYKNIASLLQN